MGENEVDEKGFCYYVLLGLSILLIAATFPISMFFCITIVSEYERAVIFRLGRCIGAKGPGMFFIVPCLDQLFKVDLRTVSMDIPPQTVLTKDSVSVQVDGVVYWNVTNPEWATTKIENFRYSTNLLACTTLRKILGMYSLAGVLSERAEIADMMQDELDKATDPWGIRVERVEIKDVKLPAQMQRAMAAEAEAAREAQAKIIAAQGEMDASRALKEAADVINQSSGALQLRYLQTLTTISAEKNSTIIFPLPIDMLGGIGKKD